MKLDSKQAIESCIGWWFKRTWSLPHQIIGFNELGNGLWIREQGKDKVKITPLVSFIPHGYTATKEPYTR